MVASLERNQMEKAESCRFGTEKLLQAWEQPKKVYGSKSRKATDSAKRKGTRKVGDVTNKPMEKTP